MKRVGVELSKAIKAGHWLDIVYHNKKGETTQYWIAVKDVDIDGRRLVVDMYNPAKHLHQGYTTKKTRIAFDRIQSAEVLDETTYETPSALYKKLDNNIEKLGWLEYDSFDSNILSYLKACLQRDTQVYRRLETEDLISGLDVETLAKHGGITLDEHQCIDVIKRIQALKKQKRQDIYLKHHELAINELSIATSKGLFVVAYRRVLFNPKEASLRMQAQPTFNPRFKTSEGPHALKHYLDMDLHTFMEGYAENPKEYAGRLEANLIEHETLDERPYLMDIIRESPFNVEADYQAISERMREDKPPIPIKAFFGNMTRRHRRQKERYIVALDNRVDIDQMRMIHNALKQYSTYVQGPPGTGKTQSILNVIVSAFFNDQTALIAASNNHPLESIFQRLTALSYKTNANRTPSPSPSCGWGTGMC